MIKFRVGGYLEYNDPDVGHDADAESTNDDMDIEPDTVVPVTAGNIQHDHNEVSFTLHRANSPEKITPRYAFRARKQPSASTPIGRHPDRHLDTESAEIRQRTYRQR
ncbi:hypothetical protein HGRIS_001490 [Hohenbuehelia grisea]|uniref:Uncharacterized protein n=1 Tax=Hohenbuehelia grisea TaxID=104357 RepID=A0ABR3JPH0_9AGAR